MVMSHLLMMAQDHRKLDENALLNVYFRINILRYNLNIWARLFKTNDVVS